MSYLLATLCRLAALLTTAFLLSSPAFSADTIHNWPKVTLPASAESAVVTPETRINGLPFRIRMFRIRWPIERLVDYFERRWRSLPSTDLIGPRRTSNETWLMSSRSRFQVSVSLRRMRGGSAGTIAIAPRPSRASPGAETFFEIPRGMRLVSSQSDSDGDSLVLLGRHSPTSDARKLVKRLSRDDWELTASRDAVNDASGEVRYLERDDEALQIVVTRRGAGTITLLTRIR